MLQLRPTIRRVAPQKANSRLRSAHITIVMTTEAAPPLRWPKLDPSDESTVHVAEGQVMDLTPKMMDSVGGFIPLQLSLTAVFRVVAPFPLQLSLRPGHCLQHAWIFPLATQSSRSESSWKSRTNVEGCRNCP